MARTCDKCGQEDLSVPSQIVFRYRNIPMTASVSGLSCEHCEVEALKKLFDASEGDLFTLEDAAVSLKWPQVVAELHSHDFERTRTLGLLLALGILSAYPDGHWTIVSSHDVCLNLNQGWSTLYFTQEEHAVGFAKAEYMKTLYSWQIQEIGKVIYKHQLETPEPLPVQA